MVAWSQGIGPAAEVQAVGFVTYFGVVFGMTPWLQMTSRGRRSRFRFWPVIQAGLIAWLLGIFWPSPQPWSVMVVVLIAIVAQLVSPWNADAARYEEVSARMSAAA